MSLTALAVVSRQGTPLYLHDYVTTSESNLLFNFDDGNDDFDGEEQVVGLTTTSSEQRQEWPCRLEYQFILHSACERLNEILEKNNWKVPPGGGGGSVVEACWVGFLCSSDNLRAYGESVSVCA